MEDSFLNLDSETFHLWVNILLLANHKDKEFFFSGEKLVCKRGQLVTGRKSLHDKLGISESKIYRLLNIFEREQLIEQQKTTTYTLITVLNYSIYQPNEQQTEQRANNERTTSEQRVNTNKNDKNDKNYNNKGKKTHFQKPTLDQVSEYCKERRNNINPQRFLDTNDGKGWVVGTTKSPMKDWKAVMRTWEDNERKKTIDPYAGVPKL